MIYFILHLLPTFSGGKLGKLRIQLPCKAAILSQQSLCIPLSHHIHTSVKTKSSEHITYRFDNVMVWVALEFGIFMDPKMKT